VTSCARARAARHSGRALAPLRSTCRHRAARRSGGPSRPARGGMQGGLPAPPDWARDPVPAGGRARHLRVREVRRGRAAPGVQQRARVGEELAAVVGARHRPLPRVRRAVVDQQLQAHLRRRCRVRVRVGGPAAPGPPAAPPAGGPASAARAATPRRLLAGVHHRYKGRKFLTAEASQAARAAAPSQRAARPAREGRAGCR